jgi:hypothetical protein
MVAADETAAGLARATVGAGTASGFRVEFVPMSPDGRFGVFQLYVQGVPLGDGSTTAVYPHYQDLQRLCALVELRSSRVRERVILGDTFDHLDLHWELTDTEVIFTVTTRPAREWGAPPTWAPPAGEWWRLSVARSTFTRTWREAEPQFRRLIEQT